MKEKRVPFISFLITLFLVISCTDTTELFQDNSTDWKSYGDANWEFIDKALKAKVTDGAGFVMTERSFKDFVLELEFKPDSTINSGVFIRCGKKELSATDCHEINIWDLHPNQEYRTGAIVARAAPLAYVETLNKWNTYKIKTYKERIQVWVNGTLTVDSNHEYPLEGFIGLQAMGTGEIFFRNVKITPTQ